MAAARGLLRSLSTQAIRVPAEGPSRNALPIVFVSSPLSSSQSSSSAIHRVWPPVFARRGYESFVFRLVSARRDDHLARLEDELVEALAAANAAFPPLMIAHGLDTLVAETYISSHPLSGLVLLSPPMADQPPSPAPSFNWEPMLPVAIFEESHSCRKTAEHRLLRDWKQYVDLEEVPSGRMGSEDAAEQVLRWMDDNGL